jgi:hypothetical protein
MGKPAGSSTWAGVSNPGQIPRDEGRTNIGARRGLTIEPVAALERVGVTPSGVRPPTFASSGSKRWAGLGARVCVGLAGAAIVGWGARHGIYGLLGAAALLVGPGLWIVARPGWRTARRIVVSDEYVESTGYGGARTRLAWDGVGSSTS